MRRLEIRSLTGSRGIAAALVFAYHFCGDDASRPGFGRFPMVLAQVGWSGVTFFFALSGFLLTSIYHDRFSAGLTAAKLKVYAIRRVARIYSVYLALLFLVFAQIVARWKFQSGPSPDLLDFASHLTMTQALFSRFATTLIPAAWSLTNEEQFYVLLPVLLLLASTRGRWLLLLLPFLFLLMGSALSSLLEKHGFLPDWRDFSLFGQLPTFFVGGLLGTYFRGHVNSGRRLSLRLSWLGWLFAFGLYAAGAWTYRSHLTWMQGLEGQALFGACALAAIVGCLGNAFPSRVLGSPAFVYGGKISYSFYLGHQLVMTALKDQGAVPKWTWLFAAAAVACVLYEAVEKPAQRAILRRWMHEVAPSPGQKPSPI